MKYFLYLLFIGILTASCQQNESTTSGQSGETAENSNQSSTTVAEMDTPSFIIDHYTDLSDLDMPRSTLSLDMNGQKIEVVKTLSCQKIEPKDYDTHDIPPGAVDACGGSWAGAGEYFYIIKNEGANYYMVMQAKVNEQGEGGYNYQSIMNFTRKNK